MAVQTNSTSNDREQENKALRLLTALPELEWFTAAALAVNYPDTFEAFDDAREALARLEEQGLAEQSSTNDGPMWRATGRGVREAAEAQPTP